MPRTIPVVGSRAVGTRTQYAPGTFSWTDLTTPEQEPAKRFYGELFGWEADDQPVAGTLDD
jgi:hypothetical protein